MEIVALLVVLAVIGIGYTLTSMASSTDIFHKEYRTKRAGFPDLLRHESVIDNGVILGKGGELIATFRYRGPDMQCASSNELHLLRIRVAGMIKQLKGGWMLHSTTVRKESITYPDNGLFPDLVTQAIENERRKQYQSEGAHYENEYYLTFTYLPEAILISKIKDFAYDTSDKEKSSGSQLLKKSIEHFERLMADYVGMLENGLSNRLERLKGKQERDPKTHRMVWFDDQISFIHECITGIAQKIRLPVEKLPTGVDFLIGSYSFLTGIRPQLDGKYIRVIAIESPPHEGTTFGILEILNTLGVQFRWTTRWIARDPEVVKASVRKLRSKWRQKIRGIVADITGRHNGAKNQDAENMANETEAILTDIESGDVSYGQWTSTVILMDDDKKFMDATVTYLMKQIRNAGFTCRDEDVNCTEAFLGSFPGHGYENLRRPEIHSMNLADCLPLTSTWQGPTENKCEFYKKFYDKQLVPPLFHGSASGGTPFRVVLHNGDIGHTLVVGPTGAGKSTILGLIEASQFRYPEAKVFGFDKGESMLALCLGAGGMHYNFMDENTSDSSSIGFAPFSQIHRLNDRTWAADYVETILVLHGIVVDLDISAEINRAIELLATRPVHMRSFTDLGTLIQSRDIRAVLSLYEHSAAGGMLNFKEDTISTNRFTVFELEHLMEMGEKHVVPVLLYLFRMIERALDGSPVLIVLDEAWLMLQHPLFEEKLKTWLKVLRKANAAVVFATQELQDIGNSPIASTIFSSCQTKILLPNPEAQNEDNTRLYKMIGLTDREIELLTYATPKRDYFFTSPAGRRLFQLELGPVALAFVGASGIDDRAIIKNLYRVHGADWTPFWLKQRNLDPAILRREYREHRA